MNLFTYDGIPVRSHWSVGLLFGGIVVAAAVKAGLHAAALTFVLGVAILASVVLHELGHAVAAKRFGIRTRSVTLYPFGGIAALEREPRGFKEESIVAIAGPAVNLVLAGVALPLAMIDVPTAAPFVAMNVGMGLFNLIPAFPMDGGRLLRAFLSRTNSHREATGKALYLSQFFAWAFVGLGIFWSPSLLMVGAFLLFMISVERRRMAHAYVGTSMFCLGGQRGTKVAPARKEIVDSSMWEHPAV